MTLSRKEIRDRYRSKPENRAKEAAGNRAWRSANLDRERAREREDKRNNKPRNRRAKILYKYGLTPERWDELFELQGRRCRCCRRDEPGSKHGWATDHDHETGAVRGILCARCNLLLGALGDNAAGVRAASAMFLRYLGEEP